MNRMITLTLVLLGIGLLTSCESKEEQQARIQIMVNRAVEKAIKERFPDSYNTGRNLTKEEIQWQIEQTMRKEAANRKGTEEAVTRALGKGGF